MRRVTGWAGLVLLLLLAWLGARAAVVDKGAGRDVDVLLSEGFESESWRIAWTVVDRDGSGDSWGRLGTAQYYAPHAGDWALGSRYRDDGEPNDDWLISPPMEPDSARRFFKIWYRSQDPNYPETVEFLALQRDAALAPGELAAHLDEFQLLERFSEVSVTWQEFTEELPVGSGGVWYFAVRNVSQDRFVLLVDDATGFSTVTLPGQRWQLEDAYRRFDFGLMQRDSIAQKPFRIWNLDAADSLALVIHRRPQPPFLRSKARRVGAAELRWDVDSTLYLWKADPDSVGSQDSLRIDFGVRSFYVDTLDSGELDTLRYHGTYLDTLEFDLFHASDGELLTVSIPFSVSFWSPDSAARLDLHQDFESELSADWSAQAGSTDTLSWQRAQTSSSANFTVPAHSWFACVNSDARGRFTADGLPLVQDAWLLSPWLDVSHTREGETARGLLLAWDQYYQSGAGDTLEILADSAGTGWRTLARPVDGEHWETRSLDLSGLAGTDSLRLAFRYQGNWSYGAALDNLVLLTVADALPGTPAPPAPPRAHADEVLLAPNPFNPLTQIRWQAAAAGRLEVTVYNLLGQRVLSAGPWLLHPGANAFPLDFSRLASGVYLVRMVNTGADGRAAQQLRRVTFLK
ncbi:MAG: choice-of-anchor J domain-containing protein [Candidatus Delongbacteria bacterium]